jgi:hypothetical protein
MAEEILATNQIYARLGTVLRDNAVPAAGCVIALTAVNLGLDAVTTGSGATFPAGFAALAAQYYLTQRALEQRGLRAVGARNRFGAFWGLNILSTLAILVGFVLLVLPGLYLSARWMVASAALLAEDSSVSDALGKSWAVTKPSLWAIAGLLLVIFVPAFVVGLGISIPFEDRAPTVASTIVYVFLFGAITISWLAGVAIYSLLRTNNDHLAEVFA